MKWDREMVLQGLNFEDGCFRCKEILQAVTDIEQTRVCYLSN